VSLFTRNGNDWTAAFPDIAEAVRKLETDDALIDGEAAVVLPDGRTSFQSLQNTGDAANRGTLVYFVFDLLRLDGSRLEALPLESEGAASETGGTEEDRTHPVLRAHRGNGDAFFGQACRAGLKASFEAPRSAVPRGPARRLAEDQVRQAQEFRDRRLHRSEGMRAGLGALLIGYYDGDRLVFCGKSAPASRTSWRLICAGSWIASSRRCRPSRPPQDRWDATRTGVKPDLVCEVVFTE